MVYQRRLWNWRWELDISLKHWMGRSLEKAIFLCFDGCLSTFYSSRLLCFVFTFFVCFGRLSASCVILWNVCLQVIFDISDFLTWVFGDDEKSLQCSDFAFSPFFVVCQAEHAYLFGVRMGLECMLTPVMIMIVVYYVFLIHMNIKGWYFFLLKNKEFTLTVS